MIEQIDKDLVGRIDPILKQMYGDSVKVQRTKCTDARRKRAYHDVDIAYDHKGNTIERTIEVGTIPIFGGLVFSIDGEPTEAIKRKIQDDWDYGEMVAKAFGSDEKEKGNEKV